LLISGIIARDGLSRAVVAFIGVAGAATATASFATACFFLAGVSCVAFAALGRLAAGLGAVAIASTAASTARTALSTLAFVATL
jgi:hypothetical protein